MPKTAFKSRYVFPLTAPPIRDGFVTIQSGKIVNVGDIAPDCEVHDLGNVAILPGLINAHTHLEFSALDSPLGDKHESFPTWIKRVVQHRVEAEQRARNFATRRESDVSQGLHESTECGVHAIGEIATQPYSPLPFRETTLRGTVFFEILGLAPERFQSAIRHALSQISSMHDERIGWNCGMSPHSPYSLHWDGLKTICQMSAKQHFPVAIHVAETRDELRLLASHDGPLRSMLDDFGVWRDDAIPRGATTMDVLKLLANAASALVVHGNYLTQDEIEFIAQHQQTMTVVYCPRTHAKFGHDRYPIRQMLNAGVRIAIGTDSRASNPDLSVWRELQCIASTFPELSKLKVLELATRNGAVALNLRYTHGDLSQGKDAALSVATLPDTTFPNPDEASAYQLLFESDVVKPLTTSTDTW